MNDNTHAMEQARAHLETITELFEAWERLEAGDDTAEADGVTFYDEDTLRDHCHEYPLSIEVRNTDWRTPGDDDAAGPNEFRILLCTGGPAVQIIGELNQWSEPENPCIQGQDWFTAWETLDTSPDDDHHQDQALDWFCRLFYFGE